MQPRTELKVAFVRAGISQRKASFAALIPETRLSAIVRGREDPKPQERSALSSVLGFSEHELFPETVGAEEVCAR